MINKGSTILKIICTNCGKEYSAEKKLNLCEACGKVLYPIYDLEKAKETLTKQLIQNRKVYNIWRMNEIMPVKEKKYRISLGEGWTPVIPINNMGKIYKLKVRTFGIL